MKWMALALAVAAAGRSLPAAAQGPDPRADSSAAIAIRCPERSVPIREPGAAPRCRRVDVQWVVTACADSAYATYSARPGPDVCLPTSLPGVGDKPGAHGTRPVVCAGTAVGYPIVRDRVGERDRCERVRTTFSPALPPPGGAKAAE